MTTFRITFKSLHDFEKYAELWGKFHFEAVLAGCDFLVDAFDILELFNHYPLEDLRFTITNLYDGDARQIYYFLKNAGLLSVGYPE